MRRTYVVGLLTFLVLAFCAAPVMIGDEYFDADEMIKKGFKRYQVERGKIEYTLEGMQTGKKTLYFDKYGWREAEYVNAETNIMGMSNKENKLNLLDGQWQYNIDLDKKTGNKIKNPFIKSMAEGSREKDMTNLGEDMMKGMGGKKTGTEKFLGKTCDVWELPSLNSKSLVWKGLTLKTEVSMMGMTVTVTATEFDDKGSFSDDVFNIPSDVTISENTDMQNYLNQMNKNK